MKNIYFLAGLPRSGSTVLAAILNQHPSVHATSTSGLLDILVGTLTAWKDSLTVQAQSTDQKQSEEEIQRILRTICEEKYTPIDKPIILDKARGWSSSINIPTMAKVLGHKPKIIATVRNIPECVASFVRVAKPDDVDDFLRTSELVYHVKESYQSLESGYQFAPECILFVDYDDLIDDPVKQIKRIHEFLELPDFDDYDFNKLDGSSLRERDEEVWLVKGLHDIKPKLGYQHNESAKKVLGHMYNQYVQPRFWLGETSGSIPIQKLDMQLAAGLMGNFEEGWKLAEEIEKEEPWNHRAAFNRGWYKLYQGKLFEGEQLMYRGRIESVFGNPMPKTPAPIWDGASKGTVMLVLEGGLGDQIHGARYAKNIIDKGCDVIIACSGELAFLFRGIKGISAVIQHEAIFGVVHDYWTPSMSTVIPLQLEYKDISGASYISKEKTQPNKKLTIGVRWQGNPAFEHEQHRLFPANMLFEVLEDFKSKVDVEFVSLQRDEGTDQKPEWMAQATLDSWMDTKLAVSKCDLVISSCTSVAHLAGSMGVPTYIIVPILPYYLWAPPGNKTVWYDSVTLFRQQQFGDWNTAFNQLKSALNDKYIIKRKKNK
jgi:hypothetical protein